MRVVGVLFLLALTPTAYAWDRCSTTTTGHGGLYLGGIESRVYNLSAETQSVDIWLDVHNHVGLSIATLEAQLPAGGAISASGAPRIELPQLGPTRGPLDVRAWFTTLGLQEMGVVQYSVGVRILECGDF